MPQYLPPSDPSGAPAAHSGADALLLLLPATSASVGDLGGGGGVHASRTPLRPVQRGALRTLAAAAAVAAGGDLLLLLLPPGPAAAAAAAVSELSCRCGCWWGTPSGSPFVRNTRGGV